MAKSRGFVAVNVEECKGCKLCVEACPVDVLHLATSFNTHGYNPSEYDGEGCTGCGVCYYACPEPGALVVFKNWEAAKDHFYSEKAQKAVELTITDPVKGLAVVEETGEEVQLYDYRQLKFVE